MRLTHQTDQVLDAAAQAIQLPDDDGTALARRVQRRLVEALLYSPHDFFMAVPLRVGTIGVGLPRLQWQHADPARRQVHIDKQLHAVASVTSRPSARHAA